MKQSLIIAKAILLTAIIVTSCKKDKDSNTPANQTPSEIIIGAWSFTSLTNNKPAGYDMYNEKTPAFFSEYKEACAKSSTLTFQKGSDNNGGLLVFDNCKSSNDNSTWILQSNVLTIGSTKFQVLLLDKATLRVTYPGGDYGNLSGTGYTKKGDITDTLTFAKK